MKHRCFAETRWSNNRIRGARFNIDAQVFEQVLEFRPIFLCFFQWMAIADSFELDSTLFEIEVTCGG